MSVGHDSHPYVRQISWSASLTTGWRRSYRRMALRIDSEFFSLSNLAEWTPMTTSSFAYFFSSFARSGMTWMQLMQQSVQKSRRTTLPFSSLSVSGLPVLSHATPPSSSGAFGSLGGGVGSSSSFALGLALASFSSAWAVSAGANRLANTRALPSPTASPRTMRIGNQRLRGGVGSAGWDMEGSEPQGRDREYLTLRRWLREHGFRRGPEADCFKPVTRLARPSGAQMLSDQPVVAHAPLRRDRLAGHHRIARPARPGPAGGDHLLGPDGQARAHLGRGLVSARSVGPGVRNRVLHPLRLPEHPPAAQAEEGARGGIPRSPGGPGGTDGGRRVRGPGRAGLPARRPAVDRGERDHAVPRGGRRVRRHARGDPPGEAPHPHGVLHRPGRRVRRAVHVGPGRAGPRRGRGAIPV